MALQTLQGSGLLIPAIERYAPPANFVNQGLIDATGEKFAWLGQVWFPGRTGAKNISRVGFRFGTVTKSGGSALTLSMQDVSMASGPPIQPDGTPDQTVAIANADANFASNTWYRSNTFSASRTVSYGDWLAVVIEFDGTRLGSDAVNLSGIGVNAANDSWLTGTPSLFTASWASAGHIGVIVLEFDDGTFGTLEGAFPMTASNTHTYNLNTAGADEYAAVVNLPWPCKVDGLWAVVAAGGNFDLVLYSGTTALATVSIDGNAVTSASTRLVRVPIPEQSLAANTDYYVALKPTTTTSISAFSLDVADANHWTLHPGGTAFQFTSRVDLGSWAANTATRRLMAGVRLSALDDGAGGAGGGLLTHPGMAGGMRG